MDRPKSIWALQNAEACTRRLPAQLERRRRVSFGSKRAIVDWRRLRIALLSADWLGLIPTGRVIGESGVTIQLLVDRQPAQGIGGLRHDATRPRHELPLSVEASKQLVGHDAA